ncbi:MAG: dynamin family protein [Syntrophales bacterium]|jgi:GTPase SAR1 family protein|nr:dynamin family protein [Syntrophales bacterium]MCK9527817.1 dynamin family protein [Syntrophales bacterium]MDX9922086.1 dynamin family protein [Syntrophales bacterium]
MISPDISKKDVSGVTEDVLSFLGQARSIPGLSSGPLREWEQIVKSLAEQLDDQLIRVAVVGAIKSGKSTFINALVGRDYLKRGAGVMTSIITRVRKSPRLEAVLDMKSWDEINDEINKALILFPASSEKTRTAPFDIRNDRERNELDQDLASLDRTQVLGTEAMDSKIALLRSYVKGYDRVRHMLAEESTVQRFEGETRFARHRNFAGEDSLAVYLKDLLLKVPVGGFLDDYTEIGDCQGVDSINPRHLAMIQEYLLRTNLIIYVISSRTGVRRADISFLSLIREMGFSDTLLFVLNSDFTEHTDLEDLENVAGRVKEELSIIVEEPDVFVFSALFTLFRAIEPGLPEKEVLRLEQWKRDVEMAAFSDREQDRFLSVLETRLQRDRVFYLLKNHIDRLSTAAENLREWSAFNRKVLSGDLDEARRAVESLRETHRRLEEQKVVIKDSLDGRSVRIKAVIDDDVERLLDPRFGELSLDMRDFLDRYTVDLRGRVKNMPEEGFSAHLYSLFQAHLYSLFQEFRESLERYIVEKINPRLVSFIREEEKKIEGIFDSVIGLHDELVKEACDQRAAILGQFGISSEGGGGRSMAITPAGIKKSAHPAMPSFLTALHFGADMRAGAIVRFGVYRGIRAIRKIFRRQGGESVNQDVLSALGDALNRIKKETGSSLAFTIGDYKERLKFHHLFLFTDTMAGEIYDTIVDRFRVFSVDMSELASLAEQNQDLKDRTVRMVVDLETQADRALERIRRIEEMLRTG